MPDIEKPKGTQNGARPDAMVVGSLNRYPRTLSLVLRTTKHTYWHTYWPQDTMRDLFTSFSINLFRDLQKPLNITQYLDANDTLPGNPDFKQVLLPSKLCSFGSTPATRPATKSCVTPPGRNRTSHRVYELWVGGRDVQHNTTFGAPTSMRIVSKDNEVRDNVPREFRIEKGIDGARWQLKSTGMLAVDNGRDADYVPSPTIIFAKARALADATNILPYFAGTGGILARSYANRVIADVSFSHIWLATFTASVLVLGIIASLCVPRLPMGARHRAFELYSPSLPRRPLSQAVGTAAVDKRKSVTYAPSVSLSPDLVTPGGANGFARLAGAKSMPGQPPYLCERARRGACQPTPGLGFLRGTLHACLAFAGTRDRLILTKGSNRYQDDAAAAARYVYNAGMLLDEQLDQEMQHAMLNLPTSDDDKFHGHFPPKISTSFAALDIAHI
ncbi:hypothetical protein HGRIS_014676 [Hohenbuehelia grisea]|uniref:Uncharacterized protein n=1 Tax=Hohenbuehelia grisea TaxID=104357 RepID=A0ABR3JWF3_9AGAR